MSADGSRIAAIDAFDPDTGDVWISTDGGVTWNDQTTAGARGWQSVTFSADGNTVVAGDADDPQSGDIFTGTFVDLRSPSDTTPPTVSLTAPSGGATVSGSSVPVSATASDNTSVAGVTFYVDSIKQGSEITSGPYQFTWDTTSATAGSHTLFAVARDTSNNYATSTIVTVTVNNGGGGGGSGGSGGSGGGTSSSAPILYGGGGMLPDQGNIYPESSSFDYPKPRQQIIYPDGHIVYVDASTTPATSTPQATSTLSVQTTTHITKQLSLGMHDAQVLTLQRYLNSIGFTIATAGAGSKGHETTLYGAATRAAVIRFQKAHGITPTGVVGSLTRGVLAKQ